MAFCATARMGSLISRPFAPKPLAGPGWKAWTSLMDIAMRSSYAAQTPANDGPKAVSKAGVAYRLRRENMVIMVNPQELPMRSAIRMPRQSSSPKTVVQEQLRSKA